MPDGDDGTSDPTNSYIEQFILEGRKGGPLYGLTLAVKDLFNIDGHRTSFGHPVWRDTHAPADQTAPAVQALLDAGATINGKTHLVELAYSLDGANMHYGMPINVAAPGRVPGGSSSGSAAAVAAGQVDIGLGSDTGGSVRVPAAFCGVCGIRPTHGRISLEHAVALAPSFDTCGWFTKDAATLRRVGAVLLPPQQRRPLPRSPGSPPRWLVSRDAFDLASPQTSAAIYDALSARFEGVVELLGRPTEVSVGGAHPPPQDGGDAAGEAAGGGGGGGGAVQEAEAGVEGGVGPLDSWPEVFRVVQAGEVWQQHGDWLQQHRPEFSPGIGERLTMASKITREEMRAAAQQRERIREHLLKLLGDDAVLTIPTAPGPANTPNMEPAAANEWRRCLLSLTSIAGLGGLPQVSLPVAKVDGLPVGLSLVGPPGSDEDLLEIAEQMMELLSSD